VNGFTPGTLQVERCAGSDTSLFAQRHASKRGRKRPETIYFLGSTLYCTRNRKDNFRVGLRTEKSRLRRALMRLQDQMRRMRHLSIREQTDCLNQMLRGHYAYYGIVGNIRALQRVHRAVERYWRKMLSSRSWQGQIWWKQFQQIADQGAVSVAATKAVSPLLGATSYRRAVQQLLTSVVQEICTLRSVGAGARVTAPATRWVPRRVVSLPRSSTDLSEAAKLVQTR
jgi:hypothetical protein